MNNQKMEKIINVCILIIIITTPIALMIGAFNIELLRKNVNELNNDLQFTRGELRKWDDFGFDNHCVEARTIDRIDCIDHLITNNNK